MDAAKLCFTHTAGHLSNSQPQHARPTECNWWRHWIKRHKVGPSARHCRNIWGTISLAQQSQRCQHQTTHLPPDSKEKNRCLPEAANFLRRIQTGLREGPCDSKHFGLESHYLVTWCHPLCNIRPSSENHSRKETSMYNWMAFRIAKALEAAALEAPERFGASEVVAWDVVPLDVDTVDWGSSSSSQRMPSP